MNWINRPKNLHGAAKLAAEAVIGIETLGRLLVDGRSRGMSLSDIMETMRRVRVIASALSENKQVLFGRHIFTDGFSPPWPDSSLHELFVSYGMDQPFTT